MASGLAIVTASWRIYDFGERHTSVSQTWKLPIRTDGGRVSGPRAIRRQLETRILRLPLSARKPCAIDIEPYCWSRAEYAIWGRPALVLSMKWAHLSPWENPTHMTAVSERANDERGHPCSLWLTAARGTTVGLLKSLTRPGLDGETFSYDGYGAPLTMIATYNGAAKGGLTLTFDALTGQVQTKAEAWAFAPISPPTKTWTYTYDSANRLESANDGTARTYTYDANGNRAGSTVDAQDRVTSQTDNGITTTYTYDAHGNVLVRAVTGVPTQSFTWDSEGSLLSVSRPPSATVTYVIDALGRRVGRKLGGVLNREWVYDGQLRIVGEYIGTKVRLYGYLPERHLPVMMVEKDGATTKTYRIYGDHLGSLRAVVDVATGNAVQVMQHDPWGKATTDTLSGGFVRVPFGFAGGIYDEDAKLVRFGAREYDPETGRWLSKDEARFGGGWNFYEYAAGDTVRFIDRTGRDATDTLGRFLVNAIGLGVIQRLGAIGAMGGAAVSTPEGVLGAAAAAGVVAGVVIENDMPGTGGPMTASGASLPPPVVPICNLSKGGKEAEAEASPPAPVPDEICPLVYESVADDQCVYQCSDAVVRTTRHGTLGVDTNNTSPANDICPRSIAYVN
jgi:RHS repeat-associated protein